MARLIVNEGPGRGTAYELVEESATIGRDPTNVIQLPSETVSRTHAIISCAPGDEGDEWTIRDMHSKNGVFVNGEKTASAALSSGDQIRLGEVLLTFVERDFDALDSRDLTGEDDKLEVRDVVRGDALARRPVSAGATAALGPKPQQTLYALLKLASLAGRARSYQELFAAIVSAIEENLRPHRTVPILFDERKGLLRPWVSRRGEFDKVLARIPISSTIVRHVQENRAAVLSEAAQTDERFRDARSITAHEITSAMCAPLLIGERLLGAIYVDRLGAAERFTKSDLELLMAFAVEAAVAVENVRMRDTMGRERYVREKAIRGEHDIVGACDAMQRVFKFISKAAPTERGKSLLRGRCISIRSGGTSRSRR